MTVIKEQQKRIDPINLKKEQLSKELWERFAHLALTGGKTVKNCLKRKKIPFFEQSACFLRVICKNHERMTDVESDLLTVALL